LKRMRKIYIRYEIVLNNYLHEEPLNINNEVKVKPSTKNSAS